MLKKYGLFIALLLGVSIQLKAQNAKVLVSTFEHQSPAMVSFPNYFENTEWTNSILKTLENWLQERFQAKIVDFKQKSPISFVPLFKPPSEPKSLRFTDYDMIVMIVSRMESGIWEKKKDRGEGKLWMQIDITDKNGRRLFKNSQKSDFIILENKTFGTEALISETDFQKLYENCLKKILKVPIQNERYIFKQPSNTHIEAFLEQSATGTLRYLERGVIEWKDAQVSHTLYIRIGQPFAQANDYVREADFMNPFDENKKYQISAKMHRAYPDYIQIEWKDNDRIQTFKYQRKVEDIQVLGKTTSSKINLQHNTYNNMYKWEEDGEIKAMLQYLRGNMENSAEFNMYLAPHLTSKDKSWIVQLLVNEIVALTLVKYYEVEHR